MHEMATRYLSSRGRSYDVSFETVVLQGLAEDGGLFMPQEIPTIPEPWSDSWLDWDFRKLAFEIFSLYISPTEIPPQDLQAIVDQSYSTEVFRAPEVTPLVTLDERKQLYLLELFHGPTFAFKDVALQFVGNLFSYFLVRRNKDRSPDQREHLTVVGATSGDTGSAAIYGLRGKKDVSIIIMHPYKRISPIQEAQMTSILDPNVHNLAVDGDFDSCQDLLKGILADKKIRQTHKIAAVNSINWARILAQITYYFAAYRSLRTSHKIGSKAQVRFVVPTGNFGDVLAGYFAKAMGLPAEKLVIATNENDILDRFWKTGYYEKKPIHGVQATGGFSEDGVKAHLDGVKETLSPAMDILVSSNFERLLWLLAFQVHGCGSIEERRKIAGEKVKEWLGKLKTHGGFGVEPKLLDAAKVHFESERVSDRQTLDSITRTYVNETPAATVSPRKLATEGTVSSGGYVLDPHSAIGVEAALRSLKRASDIPHVALATAHPAKFSSAVREALKDQKDFDFDAVLPEQFRGLEALERRMTRMAKDEGLEGLRREITSRVPASA